MKRALWSLLAGLITIPLWGQTLHFSLPEETVANGEIVQMPLTVADFDSIVSIQFSINWDVSIATYQDFQLDALSLLAVGDFQASAGELRISWFDNTGNGRTLADGTTIAVFTFSAVGDPGETTTLPITDNPLEIQLFKATNEPGIFEPVALAQDTGRISIAAPLGFSVTAEDVSCFGEVDGFAQVSLDVDTADYVLNWLGPNDFTATGYMQEGLAPGTYQLTLVDLDGNDAFLFDLDIEEPDGPLIIDNIGTTETDCNTPTGSATISVSGGTPPYAYQLGEQISATGEFENLPAGTYAVEVSDGGNCQVEDELTIIAPDAPQLDLPDTLRFCVAEELVIRPEAVGNYEWSTGATTDTLVVTEEGAYSLTVSNAAECSVSDTVEVVITDEVEAMLETDELELCPGDSLQLMVSGGVSYEWIGTTAGLSATDVADPLATPDTSITYQVMVSNACGEEVIEVPILVYEITATAGLDTCVAPGDMAQLDAKGGVFYLWEDNRYPVSDPEIPNPMVSPEDSSTYQVRIIDINGCVTEDEVTVLVANNPVASILAVNLITPNGDGLNDVLEFGNISKFGTNSLKVYNRWGNLVYNKLNYQSDEERFDGRYEDEPLPAGNYFYVLAFRQGAVQQTLTIIRE